MRTRHAASLDPGGFCAWILVMRVFHSPLIPGKTLFLFILDPYSLSMYERVRDVDVRSEDTTPFDFKVEASPGLSTGPAPGPLAGVPTARRAALLLHGFTGTPFEMRYLGEKLAARGVRAMGPRLAGHAATTHELAATSYRDWIAGADSALAELKREADKVAVVGLSLGGLIALDLARRNPDLAALVCLSVPLWLPRATVVGIRAASILLKRVPKIGGSDIRDGQTKETFPTYPEFPLLPLRSLLDLQAFIRPRVPAVKQPALVMHADHDHVAPPACARELYERLGTRDKRLVRLPESYHIITVDVEKDLVAREVGDFLKERM
jgi:carboxylesterase